MGEMTFGVIQSNQVLSSSCFSSCSDPPTASPTASPNAPPTAPTALVHHICAVVEARGKYQEHHDSERELESQAPRPTQKTPGLQLLQDYYS